jgi:hypothetical protein
MRHPRHLTSEQVAALEYEVLSTELRVHLTRCLDSWVSRGSADVSTIQKNRFINMSRSLAGLPVYVLQADDWGSYESWDYAWHVGEFHLVFRRLSSAQLIEFLGDLIEFDVFTRKEINKLFEQDGASIRFAMEGPATVELVAEHEGAGAEEGDHPNVRTLVNRMSEAMRRKDFALVLHSSASVFETLAKQVVAIESVQNATLKGFFGRYREDSKLPQVFLDYVLSLYDARNVTHLAGHGGLDPIAVTEEAATIMTEMTKAFVRIEYKLNATLAPAPDSKASP